jgi:hypothetical protein
MHCYHYYLYTLTRARIFYMCVCLLLFGLFAPPLVGPRRRGSARSSEAQQHQQLGAAAVPHVGGKRLVSAALGSEGD